MYISSVLRGKSRSTRINGSMAGAFFAQVSMYAVFELVSVCARVLPLGFYSVTPTEPCIAATSKDLCLCNMRWLEAYGILSNPMSAGSQVRFVQSLT
jgi:hypothetical protein